jgi:hypothetical protein
MLAIMYYGAVTVVKIENDAAARGVLAVVLLQIPTLAVCGPAPKLWSLLRGRISRRLCIDNSALTEVLSPWNYRHIAVWTPRWLWGFMLAIPQ